jgi:hypothetical protein
LTSLRFHWILVLYRHFRVTLVGLLLYDSHPGNRERFFYFDSTLWSASFLECADREAAMAL